MWRSPFLVSTPPPFFFFLSLSTIIDSKTLKEEYVRVKSTVKRMSGTDLSGIDFCDSHGDNEPVMPLSGEQEVRGYSWPNAYKASPGHFLCIAPFKDTHQYALRLGTPEDLWKC